MPLSSSYPCQSEGTWQSVPVPLPYPLKIQSFCLLPTCRFASIHQISSYFPSFLTVILPTIVALLLHEVTLSLELILPPIPFLLPGSLLQPKYAPPYR